MKSKNQDREVSEGQQYAINLRNSQKVIVYVVKDNPAAELKGKEMKKRMGCLIAFLYGKL